MGKLSTHVLDTALGKPASGVLVSLERVGADGRSGSEVSRHVTDADGRVRELLPTGEAVEAGTYKLTFETGAYFKLRNVEAFYPSVMVTFEVRDPKQHHHVPLLLSPFGYSTYRGS